MDARDEIFECLMPWARRPAPGDAESANEMLDAFAAEVRMATLREAAEIIRTSKHLRSWTDDHMGDIEEAAWVLQEKAEEEK